MAEAKKDNNFVTTILCTSSDDGVTPLNVKADPTGHFVLIDDGSTGSDLSGDDAVRDANRVTAWLAVSSVDGTTPVPVYVNTDGELLVDSS